MSNNRRKFQVEIVLLSKLKDHPQNYREHPDDQIEHIIESIKRYGFYKNIVVARDYTILGGHGVKKAALKIGLKKAPIRKLNIDPNSPAALKVLAGDNEMGHLAEIDDAQLIEILKEIKDDDPEGMMGTGFDEQMLAALTYVTRPASEIEDFDAAAHWVGMPDYESGEQQYRLSLMFKNEKDRAECLKQLELIDEKITSRGTLNMSSWWPPLTREDTMSVKWEAKE